MSDVAPDWAWYLYHSSCKFSCNFPLHSHVYADWTTIANQMLLLWRQEETVEPRCEAIEGTPVESCSVIPLGCKWPFVWEILLKEKSRASVKFTKNPGISSSFLLRGAVLFQLRRKQKSFLNLVKEWWTTSLNHTEATGEVGGKEVKEWKKKKKIKPQF